MKGLSQAEKEILERLLKAANPISLGQIAEEIGLKVRSANMYLLGLRKAGYVSRTESGYYALTDLGKEAIELPKVEEALAKNILSKTSVEKAFHFYNDINYPLGIWAESLVDFCEKIKSIDLKSIEFHMARGDFELWIHYLGDMDLAKRLRLIRESNLSGEALREEIYRAVNSRCDELRKLMSPSSREL